MDMNINKSIAIKEKYWKLITQILLVACLILIFFLIRNSEKNKTENNKVLEESVNSSRATLIKNKTNLGEKVHPIKEQRKSKNKKQGQLATKDRISSAQEEIMASRVEKKYHLLLSSLHYLTPDDLNKIKELLITREQIESSLIEPLEQVKLQGYELSDTEKEYEKLIAFDLGWIFC